MKIELPQVFLVRKNIVIGLLGTLILVLMVTGLIFAPTITLIGLEGIEFGLPLLLLLWFRPELGILTLIFLTSSFVPVDIIDIRLPIGGGLDLRDLVLLAVFGLLFLKEFANKTISIPWGKVGKPLVLFMFLAFISSFYALFYQNVEAHWALSDLRILLYYIVFFMVIWGVRQDSQLKILLIGLFIIADLATSIVILQQFVGANNPLLEAMMTTRDWRVYQEAGGVRVIPAGQVLMHFMWFIALGILIFNQLKPHLKVFLIFQILFIGTGHILTYMRAQWAATFLGVCLIGLIIMPRYWSLLLRYVLIGVYIFLIVALVWTSIGAPSIFQKPFIASVAERFLSLLSADKTMQTDSLTWREFENGKALDSIRKKPLLGVGLGGRYRELTTFQGESMGLWTRGSQAADQVTLFTRYVHNSYLSIAVKMGIPALVVILWFFIAFLICSWKIYQNSNDPQAKGIILGIIASLSGLLAWSFFHAHFIKAESTPVIGLMTGLVAAIDKIRTLVNKC